MQLQKVNRGPFSSSMSFDKLERHFGLSFAFPGPFPPLPSPDPVERRDVRTVLPQSFN